MMFVCGFMVGRFMVWFYGGWIYGGSIYGGGGKPKGFFLVTLEASSCREE